MLGADLKSVQSGRDCVRGSEEWRRRGENKMHGGEELTGEAKRSYELLRRSQRFVRPIFILVLAIEGRKGRNKQCLNSLLQY